MGHRSYLYVRTENGDDCLFEANNSLPFFWIGLLSNNIIREKEEAWKYYDKLIEEDNENDIESYTDIFPNPTWFEINKQQLINNSKKAEIFLKQYYPQTVGLFIDFKDYLLSKIRHHDDYLMMDIISISAFYDSAYSLLIRLNKTITDINNCIKTGFDTTYLIANGTGFPCTDFKTYSINYQKLEKQNSYYKQTPIKQQTVLGKQYKWQYFILYLTILLLCPIFTYGIYKGFLRDGLTSTVILIGLVNIGFYCFSFYKLIKQLSYLRKKDK